MVTSVVSSGHIRCVSTRKISRVPSKTHLYTTTSNTVIMPAAYQVVLKSKLQRKLIFTKVIFLQKHTMAMLWIFNYSLIRTIPLVLHVFAQYQLVPLVKSIFQLLHTLVTNLSHQLNFFKKMAKSFLRYLFATFEKKIYQV